MPTYREPSIRLWTAERRTENIFEENKDITLKEVKAAVDKAREKDRPIDFYILLVDKAEERGNIIYNNYMYIILILILFC